MTVYNPGQFNIGSIVGSGTNGSVLFIGTGSVLAQDNVNLFWDDTNNWLGINQAVPTTLLHVGVGADTSAVASTIMLVSATGATNLAIRDSTNDAEILNYVDLNGGIIGTATNHGFIIRTNNASAITLNAAGQTAMLRKATTASVANTVTFTSAHYGNYFLWSPTGTATATLPANGATVGSWFEVYVLTDFTTTISSATADTLITVGDRTADSVAFSTAGQKIGSCVRFLSDGSVWIAVNVGSTTMTVAT